MSKCNLECECEGAGKCCVECGELCFCNHICNILNPHHTRTQLQETMKNCDWYESKGEINE